jgi:Family of unknown function (DUF5761)
MLEFFFIVIIFFVALYFIKNPRSMGGGKGEAENDEAKYMETKCGDLAPLEEEPSAFTNKFLTERSGENLYATKYGDFKMIDEEGDVDNLEDNILKNILESTPVSDKFFCRKNRNHLKNLIAEEVLNGSEGKYKISPQSQSDEQLITIMRAVYLQHSRNLPTNINEQVASLNEQVLLETVPKVISNIQQELTYQRDITSQPLPMPHPVCTSSSGTKLNRGFL